MGVHSLQVKVDLDRELLGPCPSQTFVAKVETNLEDHFGHIVMLGWCPPQPVRFNLYHCLFCPPLGINRNVLPYIFHFFVYSKSFIAV